MFSPKKFTVFFLLFVFMLLASFSANALECMNSAGGTAPSTEPDDSGNEFNTACGPFAVASGNTGTAIGVAALASGSGGLAVGPNAVSSGSSSVGIGEVASAGGNFSVAVGSQASSADTFGIAIGWLASAAAENGIAIGGSATNTGILSTVIGASSTTSAAFTVALGGFAQASAERATALGYLAEAGGGQSIALGSSSQALGAKGVALGPGTLVNADFTTAVGSGAQASGGDSTALGASSNASGIASMAFGSSSASIGFRSISAGAFTEAVGANAVALGTSANAQGTDSMAIGPSSFTTAGALGSVALGYQAIATSPDTVVLGAIAELNGAQDYADVAIGTTSPVAPLHVARSNGTAGILVEETNGVVGPRTLLTLSNPGNTKFELINSNSQKSWAFTNSGIDFRVSLQDSGDVEFRVDNNGNAYLAGLVIENSDRNAKTNISPVNPEQVLEKVTALPINQWAYKETPDSHHIGPMAQDFRAAFGTGDVDTSLATMDVGGVAIAAIQALQARNQALEQRVLELESLAEEVAVLKALIRQQNGQPLLTRNN